LVEVVRGVVGLFGAEAAESGIRFQSLKPFRIGTSILTVGDCRKYLRGSNRILKNLYRSAGSAAPPKSFLPRSNSSKRF